MKEFLKVMLWSLWYGIKHMVCLVLAIGVILGLLVYVLTHAWAFITVLVLLLLWCGYDEYKDSHHG